ncbi:MAG: efflux RND transporter periplasmic adaptor subunit [Colwellia sp.]
MNSSNHSDKNQVTAKKHSKVKKMLIPVVILIITFVVSQVIVSNPPKSNRGKGGASAQITVETLALSPQPYTMLINSFGTVQPRTKSTLVAQVSGEITKVNRQFRDGGFFEKGDVLVELDDRDHQADVKINQSSLLSAQQVLLEEEARVEQALIDWQRLGNGNEPNALVLRKPQLAAAQAQVFSAQAKLDKALLILERTKVIAPYAGRILEKHVDLGRVVVSNTQLAEMYAIDYVEIRLPIKNIDLNFMRLPEEYRHSNKESFGSAVTLSSNLIGKQTWQGKIVRTEGAIDQNSQQLYIVAQINDPYNRSNDKIAPVKIGQYVNAEIIGKTLPAALVIPNSAIYQGSYVYTVEQVAEKHILKRKEITIRWQNNQDAVIDAGLNFGEQLVLTPLGQVSSGTPVRIAGDTPIMKKKGSNRKNNELSQLSNTNKTSKANKAQNTEAN